MLDGCIAESYESNWNIENNENMKYEVKIDLVINIDSVDR